jgi:hypothetical protein
MAIIKSPSIQLLRALMLTENLQYTCSLLNKRSNLRRTICPNTAGPRDRIPFRAQISTTSIARQASPAQSNDRGPVSQEGTQTDFGSLNVLGNTPPPTTSIDACLDDGFHLDNGLKIGGGSGCILLAGEAFSWRPWATYGSKGRGAMINSKGQWEVDKEAWGVLDLVWPKPGMTVLRYVLYKSTSAELTTRQIS